VVARVADLTAGATARVAVRFGDGKSGSAFERVEIGGARYLLKLVPRAEPRTPPESKEDAIEVFSRALGGHGVEPTGWFDVQAGLCQLGIMATFGWEKALGDDDDLGWWVEQAPAGARLLDDLAPGWP
jgi:hypothetical protein